MSAGLFAAQAASAIDDIAARGLTPIVTGGTGLYLTALLKGLFDHGDADPQIRARLEKLAARHGAARLHRLLAVKDPAYATKTQPGDRVRLIRALEVFFALGQPFSAAQAGRKPAFSGEALVIGLAPDRAELRERVTARVRRMLDAGLVAETQRALQTGSEGGFAPRGLGAIGYRQVAERIARGQEVSEGDHEVVRDIVTATMQYAKRQMTYFRRQFEVEWFASPAAALDRMEEWVSRSGSSA
jgi:tRNA dimethylallyltransferase